MRRPSAALVVASAALVMATIGTSVAASGYIITSSKQIKPGSISLSDISKSARKELRGARGPAGPEGEIGDDGPIGPAGDDGEDGESATNLWAQINANGGVNASSSDVTALNSAAGVYYVNFGQDISSCAVLAGQGSIPDFKGKGLSTVGIPGPAFVSVSSPGTDLATGFPSVSSALVQTRRTGGALASTSFTVAAFC
jgi:hypothetical protein